MPADFTPPKSLELNPLVPLAQRSDLWKPIAFTSDDLQNPFGNFNYAAIARLKPGATAAQATAELDAIQAQSPDFDLMQCWNALEMRVFVLPMQSEIVGKVRQSLLLLMAAVGAVLLIVCANLCQSAVGLLDWLT